MALGFFTGGTVSVTNGGTVVTGVGTAFTQVGIGAWFEAENRPVTIASVESDTSLTLSLPWGGTTLSGSADFILKPVAESASLAVQLALQMQQILNTLNLKGEIHFVTTEPLASLGDNGDAAIDTVAGALYRKADGAWTKPLDSLKGEQGDSLNLNAVGLASARSTYDAEPALFTFLAEDTGQLSIKRSATPGDWSAWIDFQGPQGVQGEVGAQWSTGAVPEDTVGRDGDLHIATTGALYQNVAGAWSDTGIDLTGPKGNQGDPGVTGPRGRSFDPDAQEPAANRVNYDGEADGFAFLATDTNQVSWKQSATSGDWSTWVDWGGAGDSSGAGSTTPLGMFVAASL